MVTVVRRPKGHYEAFVNFKSLHRDFFGTGKVAEEAGEGGTLKMFG